MRRAVPALMVLVLGVILTVSARPAAAPPQKSTPKLKVNPAERVVVGGYAESITYVTAGRHAGLVAMAVGGVALGIAPEAAKHDPETLFDFRGVGHSFRPTGFVYVPDWDRFVANDSNAMSGRLPEFLYLFDSKGNFERKPVERGPGIALTTYSEGLAYVPRDAPGWPEDLRGRLLMISLHRPTTPADPEQYYPRLDVIEARDGHFTVTREIGLPPSDFGWGSLAILPDGALVLSAYGDCELHRVEPSALASLQSGDVVATTPEPIEDCTVWNGGEGLAALPDSRLVASVEPHQLTVLEPSAGGWAPAATTGLRIGLGLYSLTGGLAWDETRDRFLVRHGVDARPNLLWSIDEAMKVSAEVRSLGDLATPFQDRNFVGLAYRADSDAAIVGRIGRAPLHFPWWAQPSWNDTRTPALMEASLGDPAAGLGKIDLTATLESLSDWQLPLYREDTWNNGPVSVSFTVGASPYAVRLNGDSRNIYVLDASGGWLRTIPVSVACADTARTFVFSQITAVPPGSSDARYLVTGWCRRPLSVPPVLEDAAVPVIAFLDADGREVFAFEPAELGMWAPSFVTAITSGRRAGAFAVLDMHGGLVTFRVK